MQKKRIVLEREKLEFLAAESSNWSIKSGSNLRAAKAIILQGRDVGNCSDDSIVMADKENSIQFNSIYSNKFNNKYIDVYNPQIAKLI